MGRLIRGFPRVIICNPRRARSGKAARMIGSNRATFILKRRFDMVTAPNRALKRVYCFDGPCLFYNSALFSNKYNQLFRKATSRVCRSLGGLDTLPSSALMYYTRRCALSGVGFTLDVLPRSLSVGSCCHGIGRLQTGGRVALPMVLGGRQRVGIFLEARSVSLVGMVGRRALLRRPRRHFT